MILLKPIPLLIIGTLSVLVFVDLGSIEFPMLGATTHWLIEIPLIVIFGYYSGYSKWLATVIIVAIIMTIFLLMPPSLMLLTVALFTGAFMVGAGLRRGTE